MKEWKSLASLGFSQYEVNADGDVRTIRVNAYGNHRILKRINYDGYEFVNLHVDGLATKKVMKAILKLKAFYWQGTF